MSNRSHVVVIGGGFTGLSAAYELARRDIRVTVLEKDASVGGLAGSFEVGGQALEKFYHHWFTNDRHVMDLVEELGAADQVLLRNSRTGMYFAHRFYRLSTPFDLLRFKALPFLARLRLGWLTLRVRAVKDWRALEAETAERWLRRLGGEEVFRVVWEPLLRGKFGPFADQVSAVWFWNKLKLRGGSRGKGGAEQLAYFRGGFAALSERLASVVKALGGEVLTSNGALGLVADDDGIRGVMTVGGEIAADAVIATTPLPLIADLLPDERVDPAYLEGLRRIKYLSNVCVVLVLDRSLSDTYWVNVNDPDFPFVGVIEHTNLEPESSYGGRHIVYLSKYLPSEDRLYRMTDTELVEFCEPYLCRMFPKFSANWVMETHVWRADYSQPIVERHYEAMIPATQAPLDGLYIASMAQIYPEDRGTNYAIREGRRVGTLVADELSTHPTAERAATLEPS